MTRYLRSALAWGMLALVSGVGLLAICVADLVESVIVRFKKSRHEAARSAYQEAYQKSESEKPTTQRGDAKKSWKESDRARRVVEREAKAQRAAAKARQEDEEAQRKAEEAFAEWQLEAERAQREVERARLEAERVRLEEERAREEARREALRKREEYWNGLSGLEFEKELGTLCERRGYKVSFTPISGDEGVDLILQKNGKTTVVQCKRHKSPTGPAVVRELFGSMTAFRADNAILACTGGFTKGAKKFADDNSITLVSALDLARMSEIVEAIGDMKERGGKTV